LLTAVSGFRSAAESPGGPFQLGSVMPTSSELREPAGHTCPTLLGYLGRLRQRCNLGYRSPAAGSTNCSPGLDKHRHKYPKGLKLLSY